MQFRILDELVNTKRFHLSPYLLILTHTRINPRFEVCKFEIIELKIKYIFNKPKTNTQSRPKLLTTVKLVIHILASPSGRTTLKLGGSSQPFSTKNHVIYI